jgi:hypothetical protein
VPRPRRCADTVLSRGSGGKSSGPGRWPTLRWSASSSPSAPRSRTGAPPSRRRPAAAPPSRAGLWSAAFLTLSASTRSWSGSGSAGSEGGSVAGGTGLLSDWGASSGPFFATLLGAAGVG